MFNLQPGSSIDFLHMAYAEPEPEIEEDKNSSRIEMVISGSIGSLRLIVVMLWESWPTGFRGEAKILRQMDEIEALSRWLEKRGRQTV